jgi:hypothetical protein
VIVCDVLSVTQVEQATFPDTTVSGADAETTQSPEATPTALIFPLASASRQRVPDPANAVDIIWPVKDAAEKFVVPPLEQTSAPPLIWQYRVPPDAVEARMTLPT